MDGLLIHISGLTAEKKNDFEIPSSTKNFIPISIQFGEDWTGAKKYIQYIRHNKTVEKEYVENEQNFLPVESISSAGELRIAFRGLWTENDKIEKIATTNPLVYYITNSLWTANPDNIGDIHEETILDKLYGIVQSIRNDADSGKFKGEKGDKGDKGEFPQVDAELSETSENPLQNKVISNALNQKQQKTKWELIRNFTAGDETTYNDNDIMVYDDSQNLKQILIVADNNSSPFYLSDILIRVTYPARTDITTNFIVNCDPYSCVTLNDNGFPVNASGYKFNNSYLSFKPTSAYSQIIVSSLQEDGRQSGYCTSGYTNLDSAVAYKLWANKLFA